MKYLFFILLIFINTYTYSINLSLIKLTNINGINEVEKDILFLINNGRHLDNYIPDKYWDFKYTKQEYTEIMIRIIDSLHSLDQDKNNQDYYLLMGLLYFYLYNLDYPNSYDRAMENLSIISDFEQKDYRYKWFSGIINAKAAKSYLAIRDFEYITERVPEESLYPMFWGDYGFSALMAFMPGRSMEYFEKQAEFGDKDLADISIYQGISNSFVEGDLDHDIEYKDLYRLLKRENGLGFISYPFGIWIPTLGEWNVRQLDYKNRFSAIVFGSQKINDGSGNDITYSIGTYIYVDDDNDHITKQLDEFPKKIEIEMPGISDIFTIYEVWDPDLYSHIGGAHGFVAFYKSDAGIATNQEIEQASKINTGSTNGETYIPFSNKIMRISDNITYIFLLDSCENIYEQSKKDFVNFMSKVLIE